MRVRFHSFGGVSGEGHISVMYPTALAAELIDKRAEHSRENEADKDESEPVESGGGDGGSAFRDGFGAR